MPNDIYRPPTSNLSTDSDSSIGTVKRVIVTIFLLVAIFLCYSMDTVTAQFGETFASFGTDLPLATTLTIKIGFIFSWLALFNEFLLLIWVGSIVLKKQNKPLYIFIKYHLLFSAVLFAAAIVSLYLPVFHMEEVG